MRARIFITALVLAACKGNEPAAPVPAANAVADTARVLTSAPGPWADAGIQAYIKRNIAPGDTVPVVYRKTYREHKGKNYLVAEIGHSQGPIFKGEKYIFIDSLSQAMYEYNFDQDSLIPVK